MASDPFSAYGYAIATEPSGLSEYAALDDSFAELSISGREHFIFVSYLANDSEREAPLLDASLVFLHPKTRKVKGSSGIYRVNGNTIASFLARYLVPGKKLVACRHYLNYQTCRPLIHEPTDKEIRKKLKVLNGKDPRIRLHQKAHSKSRSQGKTMAKALSTVPYRPLLEEAIRNYETSITVGGIEVLFSDCWL